MIKKVVQSHSVLSMNTKVGRWIGDLIPGQSQRLGIAVLLLLKYRRTVPQSKVLHHICWQARQFVNLVMIRRLRAYS